MTMREVRPGVWKGEVWHQGRRQTITFHGSASDAKLYEAQKRIEIRQTGIVDLRSAPPFETFCVEQYKPYAKAHLRKRTWDDVRRYQVEHLIMFFKDTKLTHVREPLIERYKQERRESVGKVTINSELSALSAILTYARDVLKVPCANPKINYFRVRPKKGRVKFWTLEELQRLYDTCMSLAPSLFPLVLFLGQTGARKSEALHLPWTRVDFGQKLVKIWSETRGDDEDDDEDDQEPYEVKSVEREVPLSDALLKVLAELKLRRISGQWVFPVKKGKNKGEQYTNFPKHSFDRVVKAAGLKGGPHKLRHSFASNFVAKKPDLYLLGRLLGHSHERVTALYAHLVPGYLEEARNVVPVTVPEPLPKPNPVHRPVHRAKDRARILPQVAGIKVVGARGFEPPTPTVSR
jgi:integrase